MKTGDKLYCINTIKNKLYNYNYFIKDNPYIIFHVSENKIQILDEKFGIWHFYINGRLMSQDEYQFNNHFVSLVKYRKLKINKIQNEK